MVDIRILIKLLGGLLVIFGVLLCIPATFSVFHDLSIAHVFAYPSITCGVLGYLLFLSQQNYTRDLNHRTGFAVVAVAWLTACAIGALPYYLSGTFTGFLDSFFESVSGFSGTGASVLTDIESQSKPILLWRSLTQWIGGMGIIVFFIAILPMLGLGGVQLFKAEITGPQKDKITPRVRETAKKLWFLYVAFTALQTLALIACGLSGYDALNHSLTTISTGGFSTKNRGIAHFDSALVDYIFITFMLLSSINFSLHFRLFVKRDLSALFTTELKWYLTIIGLATFFIMISLWSGMLMEIPDSFRSALFTVVCTISSTGYTYTDYSLWPGASQFIIMVIMICGGMSGSTAGGVKCIRIVTAIKQMHKEVRQIVHPSALYSLKANKHTISDSVVNAIWGFIFLYIFIAALITLILSFQDMSLLSAFTATLSALSNIGPGLGELGPYDNYAALSSLTKSVLCLAMLLGRLEFFTILVILTPVFWRR